MFDERELKIKYQKAKWQCKNQKRNPLGTA
jgi:hypothetical protein